jgi:nucleoid-associated protein YgaU
MRISELSDQEYMELRLERRRAARRRTLMIRALAILAAAFLCVLSFHAFAARVSAEDKIPSFKYYTSVVVKAGDTLSSISGEYMDSEHYTLHSHVKEICTINHLEDADSIRTGMVLIVPYYSTDYISY